MPNSYFVKQEIEPYVHAQLKKEFQCEFSKLHMPLTTGGYHEFDAVSDNGEIVASIKSIGGKTKSGKFAAANYLACVAELYFLSLVHADQRFLVLTDSEMHKQLENRLIAKNRLASGIDLKLVQLPDDLHLGMQALRAVSRKEVSPLTSDSEMDN
jgi:hypothetical protein